jgi:hypothetical protein
MFGWLFGRDKNTRFIFHFMDGNRKRSVDPITVERTMIAVLGSSWRGELENLGKPIPFGIVGEALEKASDDKEKMLSKVLYAIDAAFDVKSFKDGEGLTELERLGLLTGFNNYCRDLVERARPFVKQPSRASPGPEPSPTPNGVGSI